MTPPPILKLNKNPFSVYKYVTTIFDAVINTGTNQISLDDLETILNIHESQIISGLTLSNSIKETFRYHKTDRVLHISAPNIRKYQLFQNVLIKIKEKYKVSPIFEEKLYEIIFRRDSLNNIFDHLINVVFDLRLKADLITKFFLKHMLEELVSNYGVIGKFYTKEVIQWELFPFDEIFYTNDTENAGSAELNPFQEKLNINNVIMFIKKYLNENSIDAEYEYLLNNAFIYPDINKQMKKHDSLINILTALEVLSENKKYTKINWPKINVWHFHHNLNFIHNADFYNRVLKRKINKEYVTYNQIKSIIFDYYSDESDIVKLKDITNAISYNIQSIQYQLNDQIYRQKIRMPISYSDSKSLGSVLWAVYKIPDLDQLMTWSWFKQLIEQAYETTQLLITTLNMDYTREPDILLLSKSVEKRINHIANLYCIGLESETDGKHIFLTIPSKLNRERLNLPMTSRSYVDKRDLYHTGFNTEIVEKFINLNPYSIINIEKLCDDLGVTQHNCELFINSYAKDTLLFKGNSVSIRDNPWITFPR
jgi:hypothetical protein